MSLSVRKVHVARELIYREGGRSIEPEPWRTCVVAAVVKNPWFGLGYVEDLDPLVRECAPAVAEVIVPRLLEELGGAERIEAYGKAALGGDGAAVEHSAALIQTLRFGNVLRDLAGGETYMSSTCKRGAVAGVLTVPMIHKNDPSHRGHNVTASVVVPDAPRGDEILVAVAGASGARPFFRQTGP
ncbi:amino acid synthesis family protein [Phytohabitans sp. ZYX-F-186]|uniref:Amino acid synthesis family protein n=1 Tax=Phytohabitans maris TaxID=3071409 RepID=A0ABU0ZVS7_9ACTN|nr:amino acid synthesis family protein [Phytohabitans sp. ZYX-F-186]MDQ7911126.1 amino acid synthesis family protein [Phytohabitans sp. ZYX-F-186]